ncbi:MAG TPA: site-2 protease family protein [Gemmatimonadales bacterium]|nr:site-2 protease family protein [Gemmatimonadales bacterium]
MQDLPSGLAFYVVFLFSTVLHEAAHAAAALMGGDPTAYHGGQVTLDPRPHIRREPFGMVIMPLISVIVSGWPFGFASAPYDPHWASRYPRRAAWMALAGPGANLLLAVLAAIAIRIGHAAGVFTAPESVRFAHVVAATGDGVWSAVAFVVSVFFSMNLVLAALNILPFPPLDGSAALPLFLSDDATARYQDFLRRNPGLGILGIFLAWQVFDFVFDPIFLVAINLLYPGVRYG